MRRLVLLTLCLLAVVPAFAVAHAAVGKGTVSRSWISTKSGGDSGKTFSVKKVTRLYANFTWKTPASPGQDLRIEWRDPKGNLQAVWKNKTIKEDKKGTRLFAWIGPGVMKDQLGNWSAVLTVGGTRISMQRFHVVA